MKIGFNQQLLINFGIVLGATAAATTGLYFLSADITVQANKIIFDRALVERQAAVVGILAGLKSDAPKAAQYVDAMKKLLPTHDELIGFSPLLDTLGRTHSVSVTFSFRGDNTAATESLVGSDGLNLSVTGASGDIMAFFDDMETKIPGFLLSIETFDLVKADAGYRLTMQGRLFSRAPSKQQ